MNSSDQKIIKLTKEAISQWANNQSEVVALTLKQTLLAIDDDKIIFPPTYADIGYNIDTLSDGTKIATIDSVGSQANRIEPIFMHTPYSELVPQINMKLGLNTRSIFETAHRIADAVAMSCPKLAVQITAAFASLAKGDAMKMCALAPTSLLFGVWDSRGGASQQKRPRILRSIVRAWDVEQIYSAAQFNSVSKSLNEETLSELKEHAKKSKKKLSASGFADAPATFRKVSTNAAKYLAEFKEGTINLDRRVLGGVLVHGKIERTTTINLVALRSLCGKNDQETTQIREYILGLTLLAATADLELYFREGCLLRYKDEDSWRVVPRRGELVNLTGIDQAVLLDYTKEAVKPIKNIWSKDTLFDFDVKKAKELIKDSEEESGE